MSPALRPRPPMNNAVLFIPLSPPASLPSLSCTGPRGSRRSRATGALPVFERDADTLAAESQFYPLLLGREIDDHPMLVVHGLGSGPAPHRHIRVGSHVKAVKIGYPAEIVDRALRVEVRKAYTSHFKALDAKAICLAIVERQCAIAPLCPNAGRHGCSGQ